jgi:hypothetical protein
MDNNCAENHYWQHLGVGFTTDLLTTMPAIGNDNDIPFFLHGRYVERFWQPTVQDGEATFYMSSCDVLRITVEIDLLRLSIEDGKVIGLHYPEIS